MRAAVLSSSVVSVPAVWCIVTAVPLRLSIIENRGMDFSGDGVVWWPGTGFSYTPENDGDGLGASLGTGNVCSCWEMTHDAVCWLLTRRGCKKGC